MQRLWYNAWIKSWPFEAIVNIQNLSFLKCTKGSNNIGGFFPIDFCLIEYQIYMYQ